MPLKFVIAALAAAEYVLLHELGHFLVASLLGLGPKVIVNFQNAATGAVLGVSYSSAGVASQGLVILGASILPLLFAFIFTLYTFRKNSYFALVVTEIFLVMVLANLLPLPGFVASDANKLLNILGS